MIMRSETMPLILAEVPSFAEKWQQHRDWWGEDEPGLCNDIGAFSDYIEQRIIHGDNDSLPPLFALVERLLVEGEPDVADATATCVLENLLNRSPSVLDATRYVPLLGAHSRAYAHAWDEFSGIQTPGL